jgi:hypothetical protein
MNDASRANSAGDFAANQTRVNGIPCALFETKIAKTLNPTADAPG